MEEDILMSRRQANRIPVLEQVKNGKLSLLSVSSYLDLSYRQTKRIRSRYAAFGIEGLKFHGNRQKRARNKGAEAQEQEILGLFNRQYSNYNETHFTEILTEKQVIKISARDCKKAIAFQCYRSKA